MLSPKLETERLILRRWQASDIDVLYEMTTDKRLSKFLKMPNITKEDELKRLQKWIIEADDSLNERWVITEKSTEEIVGKIDVESINKKNNYCSIGYMLRYEYWGNGYMSEAVRAVANYLLTDRGYYLVEGYCHELNKASSKVMLNAGFVKDGYIANRRVNDDGTYSGLEYYSKSR